MKYLDESEGLMRSWKSDEDTNFYQSQDKIDEFYGDLETLDRTIGMWKTALDRAKPEDEAQRRRLLTRSKQRKLKLVGYQNASSQEIDEISSLINELGSDYSMDALPHEGKYSLCYRYRATSKGILAADTEKHLTRKFRQFTRMEAET
ncbi:hypothetical protein [Desulfosporosinus sp. FKA]|uniref:hypothetical protein n=1 Tax=Desulfosporosinus sp. FKA TaxID=1969834 RepID=UPI000B49D028|nr:hypothetical protein [Desulfosporosinus sp. FKA]